MVLKRDVALFISNLVLFCLRKDEEMHIKTSAAVLSLKPENIHFYFWVNNSSENLYEAFNVCFSTSTTPSLPTVSPRCRRGRVCVYQ